jgi:hypothetical protein
MKRSDAARPTGKDKRSVLRAVDVLGLIRKETPGLLTKMPAKRAVGLLNAAFLQLGRHIDSVKTGVLKVPGFGTFRVRRRERNRKGSTVSVTRTIFRAAKSKSTSRRPRSGGE